MSSLKLYAETPRAGQFGHRFLVPEGISASESEVVTAFASVREGVSRGQDYIAVGRKVKQLSIGGTTRDGLEVIVLTGLNAATLSDCIFNQLVEVLRRHSLSLEPLVLTGIDWGKVFQDTIIVPSSEMREWLSEIDRVAASEANWSAKLISHASANSGLKRNGSTARATHSTQRMLLVGGALFFFGVFPGAILGWFAKGFAKVPLMATPEVVEHSEPESQLPSPSDSEFDATDKKANSDAHAVQPREMFLKAIQEPGSSSFVTIISAWPDGVRFPDSATVYEPLLDSCKTRLGEKKFDEVLTLLDAFSARESEFPRDSHFDDLFHDMKNKAKYGTNGLDSSDQKDYEAILSAGGRERIDAAKYYLKSGARRTMGEQVEQWLMWAERPLVLEITATKLATQGPCRIFVEFEGNIAGVIVDKVDAVSASSPLSISLSSLGITMLTLPCECSLYTENQSGSTKTTKGLQSALTQLSGPPTRSAGKYLLNGSSGRQWKVVELSSDGGLASSIEELSVRMANQDDAPNLPNWHGGY